MRGKFTILAIFFAFYILHSTFYIPVSAQEICQINEECPEDTYYTDSTTGQCIHKHGGYCDPGSEYTDPNTGCVYLYDQESDGSKCSTTEPIEEPSPSTPAQPILPTSAPPEEQAIYNLNQGLLPTGNQQISCELNIFQQIISFIFKIRFCDPEEFFKESQIFHQSELPSELTPTGDNREKLEGYLIDSYGITLPFQNPDVRETEKLYEQSHFPLEISPIIGYK